MTSISLRRLLLGLSALALGAASAGRIGLEARAQQTARPADHTADRPFHRAPAGTPGGAAAAAAAPVASAALNEAVKTYCVGCHNERVHSGELSLASFDVAKATEHAEVAEKMVRKLRTGMMPPRGASRKPDADSLSRW